MGKQEIGPREKALREMREARFADNAKPRKGLDGVAPLAEKVAAIKVKPPRAGKTKRK